MSSDSCGHSRLCERTLERRHQSQQDGGGDERADGRGRDKMERAFADQASADEREQDCGAHRLQRGHAAPGACGRVAREKVAARCLRGLLREGRFHRAAEIRGRRHANAQRAGAPPEKSERLDSPPVRRADPGAVGVRRDARQDALRIMRAAPRRERLVDKRQPKPPRQRAIIIALADPALAQHHLFGRNVERCADSRRGQQSVRRQSRLLQADERGGKRRRAPALTPLGGAPLACVDRAAVHPAQRRLIELEPRN